jgi:DNA-binding CsgD family transcriptional regulator
MPTETKTNPVLTRYQRRALWFLSQGHTPSEAAALLKVPRQSVTDALYYARRKLGTRTNAQAVLVAYVRGVIGELEDCGSREAYVRHRNRNQDACPACLRANREWVERSPSTAGSCTPLEEPQVRLVRALHVGRTQRQIRMLWGLSRSQVERQITALYAALGVAGEPREIRRERALEEALRQGYLNPAVKPQPCPVLPPVTSRLTPAELRVLSAVDGRTLTEAAALLGTERTTISSHLNRAYTKLGVGHLARKDKREAALKEARNQGYAV